LNSNILKGEGEIIESKMIIGIVFTLLLVSMLALVFDIQPVIASGTITIRPDGSVDPDTACMHNTKFEGIEFLRKIYISSGLSVRPRAQSD